MNPPLDPVRIEAALRVGLRGLDFPAGAWRGKALVRKETDSTNNDALDLGKEGAPDGTAVFAEEQRTGRGRRGKSWSAPPGRNLTFSVVVRTALGPECWSRVAHAAALAVARAVDPWLEPFRAGIKWPNDIHVDGRKLAGILVEAHPGKATPFLVVGIGLNVNSPAEEIALQGVEDPVTSIASLRGGREVDRNELAGALVAELWRQVRRCEGGFEDARKELCERSCLLGKRIRVRAGGKTLLGEAVGLGGNGELLIQEEEGGAVREIVSADQVRLL